MGAVRGVTDKLLDESDFVCTHNIEDLEKKIAILNNKKELELVKRQKDQIKKFYEGELRKLKEEIIDLKVKGKKRKERKKSEISLPKPPIDDIDDDILLTPHIGMGVAETIQEEQSIADEDNEHNEDNDNDGDDDKEQEQKEENVQSTELKQKEDTKRDDESDEDDEDESSEDYEEESDDDERPKKLLGISQSHLTRLHKQKNGPSPKQINKFLKDLHKKKEANYDTFCIEDVETIMHWTKEEVAYWIYSINFEQYAFAFYCLPIDGDMLIRDMNKESIIEDLGVMKVHSARILRQIDKLRRIIHEGFDEDVIDGISIEPDKERPTMDQIESLQDVIEKLEKEIAELREALDDNNNNDEESGYFTKKIQDLETDLNEIRELKEKMESDMEAMKGEHSEEIETLNNTLNESMASNDSMKKELKTMKKELRRAKRGQNGDEMGDDDEDESEEEDDDEKEDEQLQDIEITHSRAEIEEIIISEMQTNTEFGFDARALEWSPAEVCNWLKSIQFSPYMEVFYSAQILGDVLLQDLGSKMLRQFKVKSMHIAKLLRQIENLRKTVMEKGVRITVSDGINDDSNSKKEKKSRKSNKKKPNNQQMQKLIAEHQQKLDEFQRIDGEKNEQLQDLEQQVAEEKQVRIGYELELEQLKNEYEALAKTGSKQKIERLENLISNIEESKIRTVRDLNDQLNSLRIGCRLMQKEIAFLKTKQGFHPIDSLVSTLGYSSPPKY